MNRPSFHLALLAASTLLGPLLLSCRAQEPTSPPPRKVVKTDREWAQQLTRTQYLVTRQKATEPAFSGRYYNNHAKGEYLCVCCDADLFSSRTKFDSGTGWPSFWKPTSTTALDSRPDYEDGTERIEVLCRDCGAHLGHVFNDGPPPTGLRYCINSASLRFVKGGASVAKAPAKKKAKAESVEGEAKPPETPAADPQADAPKDKDKDKQ